MALMECHCVLKLHRIEVVFFTHNMFCTKKIIKKICGRGKWNTPRWKEDYFLKKLIYYRTLYRFGPKKDKNRKEEEKMMTLFMATQ